MIESFNDSKCIVLIRQGDTECRVFLILSIPQNVYHSSSKILTIRTFTYKMHRGCFVFCEEYTGLQSNEMQFQPVPPYWTRNLGDNSLPTSRQLDMQSRLPRSIGAARGLGLERRVRRPQEKTLLSRKRPRRRGTLQRQTQEISCREMSLQELQCSRIELLVVFA